MIIFLVCFVIVLSIWKVFRTRLANAEKKRVKISAKPDLESEMDSHHYDYCPTGGREGEGEEEQPYELMYEAVDDIELPARVSNSKRQRYDNLEFKTVSPPNSSHLNHYQNLTNKGGNHANK